MICAILIVIHMNYYFLPPPTELEEQVLPKFSMLELNLLSPNQIRIRFKKKQNAHIFTVLYYPYLNQSAFEKALSKLNDSTLLVAPYLDSNQLNALDKKNLSGFDLSGNAVMTTENWSMHVSGEPNRFHQATSILNPYQGRSGLIIRALLKKPNHTKLDDIYQLIQQLGGQLSPSLVSRTIQVLEQNHIVSRSKKRQTQLIQPDLAIQKLIQAWSDRQIIVLWRGRINLVKEEFLPQIFQNAAGKAVMTGIGSIQKYTNFSSEQTTYIYTQHPQKLLFNLPTEETERFVNLEIRYCKDPGAFFDVQTDENGIVWASMLQTIIEAKNADARLQAAAEDIKNRLITQTKILMLEA